ncbi:class I SAM-dependent methyltransferase [Frigidibacter sp. RF13]|uniref:class I SAM-dependent methyltransferase n=1 Tax=Frigidibacter sp. RF13 TaxID=2997340 RepID=UPI00226DC813|nr:class I SAM-dependent methyltransferase [Frigidibacter sp. RF13]MCY1128687.1 class I SAM-dependent methyltransferase [Frigidibacter sp. RF13]
MCAVSNAGQAEFWNGEVGQRWLAREAELEAGNRAVTDFLLSETAASRPGRILEVGCGSGGLALQLADKAPETNVTGADISVPLLERARARGAQRPNLAFLLADVQTARLPGPFDMVVSAFGMMFFDDPQAAFANIRGAMAPDGQMIFVTFGAPAGNPWFGIPRRIAVARMGEPPTDGGNAPGPLAFADGDRVVRLLRGAGWNRAEVETRSFDFHHPGGPDAAAALAVVLGPAAYVLRAMGAEEADRQAVRAAIAAEFAAFAQSDGLRLPIALNIFRAAA